MTWGTQARALTLAIIIITTPLLTACGPYDTKSQIGITVDDAGNPVIVLQDCEGIIDTLDIGGDRSDARLDAELTKKKPAKGITQIQFYTGGSGWTPTTPIPTLRGAGDIYISSRSEKKPANGGGVIFSLADLKTLKPGPDPPPHPRTPVGADPVQDRSLRLQRLLLGHPPRRLRPRELPEVIRLLAAVL